MKNKTKAWLIALGVIGLALVAGWSLRNYNFAVLNPKGVIGFQERRLIYEALLLSLVVVIPVFSLTFFIAWKYRASNTKAKYSPDWDHSRIIESIWWGVPTILIVILSFMAWNSSHVLDPYKSLSSTTKPLTIQVIALQWKWLFIYPEQHIASVNFVQFPVNTPINFEITSDAPMNSFWIPQLGGQIYAMPGMTTQLHLMADQIGNYRGSSANISGQGFAGMVFTARASSLNDFTKWVGIAGRSSLKLTEQQYQTLLKPSSNNPTSLYSAPDAGLYDRVVLKYMLPASELSALPPASSTNTGVY